MLGAPHRIQILPPHWKEDNVREPLNLPILEQNMERLKDNFRERKAQDLVQMAELILGLTGHIQRLENVLTISGAIHAPNAATLQVSESSITMKKDGTIQIKGKDITLSGSGKIAIKADSDLTLKGSKIFEN
jgi:hypothetical protein